jgi:hypothetical protein
MHLYAIPIKMGIDYLAMSEKNEEILRRIGNGMAAQANRLGILLHADLDFPGA